MAPQTATEYKSNIMERLGGQSVFDFIVLGMVERLQQDSSLDGFFSNYGSSLESLQSAVLTAMFTKHADDYDVDGFILLRFYRILELGFNETHFDTLVKHFIESLQDAWVEDDVFEDAVRIIKSFRPIFVNTEGKAAEEEAAETISSKVEESTVTKEKTAPRRGSSGEFLLNLMRPKGSKRTKQASQ
mmetsp:Transcript_112616/g.168521  ORF Transcript_112616/g.168521 Transcript_112616/m.168521 type:complete len:187 (+) Transcript_112616:86-646(+)